MIRKHSVIFALNNISVSTQVFTPILQIDTSAAPVAMRVNSSGNLCWKAAAFSNPVGEQCSLNGVVAVKKDAGGVVTIDSGGGFGGTGPTTRVQTGGISATTPEIDVTESAGVLIVQAKAMQVPGVGVTYNAPSEYVVHMGSYYRCVLSHSTVETPPNATYWVSISFQGAYIVNNAYSANQWVFYLSQYWYTTVSVPAGPGNEPGTSGSWVVAVDRGTWSAGTPTVDLVTDVVGYATFEFQHNS